MPTLSKTLAEETLKVEKGQEPLLPTDLTLRPKFTGMKIAVWGAFILSLSALAGAGFLYQSLNGEMRQRQALAASHSEVLAKAKNFENEAGRYQVLLLGMRDQLKDYANERKQFKNRLEQNRIEIVDLKRKIQAIEEQDFALQAEAVAFATPAVNAPVIIEAATPVVVPPPPPAPKQEILTVNRKFNFVVVNLGIKDGIKMGETLDIQRRGKSVGKVQVEKLYDSFSAAAILEENEKTPIKVGDLITRS